VNEVKQEKVAEPNEQDNKTEQVTDLDIASAYLKNILELLTVYKETIADQAITISELKKELGALSDKRKSSQI
jgi:plasmid replication initiation protein